MSHIYRQILLDHTRQSTTYAHKTVPKTAEFRKQHKQLVIQLVIKSLKKLQKLPKLCKKIIQKHLQMSIIKKYLKKDIYLRKKINDDIRSI